MQIILTQKHLTTTNQETIYSSFSKVSLSSRFFIVNNDSNATRVWLYYSTQGNYDANSLLWMGDVPAYATEILELELPFRGKNGILGAKASSANVVTINVLGKVIT